MVQEQSRCRGSALVFFLASSVLDAAELHGARQVASLCHGGNGLLCSRPVLIGSQSKPFLGGPTPFSMLGVCKACRPE